MKKKFVFFVVFFLCLSVQTLFSDSAKKSGQEEGEEAMSLFEIEKLIRDTDYNEALRQLQLYIQRNPESFDKAQRLIKTIMNRRSRYSVLAERAIKSNTENPEDHETPARLILEMRGLEKNPPEEIRRMIDMLEDMHLFHYYAYLFENIQEESAQRTARQDYDGAVQAVQDGFWIYHDEFLEQWAGHPELVGRTDVITHDLTESLSQLRDDELRRSLDSSVSSFIRNVRADRYSAAVNDLKSVTAYLERYSSLRNRVLGCAARYEAVYKNQRELDPEITDASYLPFMQRFVTGISSVQNSGLIGALDARFSASVEGMKSAVTEKFSDYSNKYVSLLPPSLLDGSSDTSILKDRSLVQPAKNYAGLGMELNAFYTLLDSYGETEEAFPEYSASLRYASELYEKNLQVVGISEAIRQELLENQRVFEYFEANQGSASIDTSSYIDYFLASGEKIASLTGSRAALLPDAFDWGREYAASSGDEKLSFDTFSEKYLGFVDELFSQSRHTLVRAWTKITDAFSSASDSYVESGRYLSANAVRFTRGFGTRLKPDEVAALEKNPAIQLEFAAASDDTDGEEGLYHYAGLSLEALAYSEKEIRGYISDVDGKISLIDGSFERHSDLLQDTEISGIVEQGRSRLSQAKNELSSELSRILDSQAAARSQRASAAYARQSADALYEDAYAAFRSGDFDRAEQLLVQSSEKYAEALSISDDHELQKRADDRNISLSQKILDAKNELVVRETREFYTQAREAQNRDRYEDAEKFITAAINKWAETHSEANPELEAFRELINTAITMKTGRNLLPPDPLYAEMSQLLSLANQSYTEGEQYMRNGAADKARDALDSALENLSRLKKVYPLNQDASLLILKIDRLLNPSVFNSEFAQRIKLAVAQCDDPATQSEGYNSLMDYYNLEPDYPGLKDTVYNVEIKLGMRQKPVDNSSLNRASVLMAQARQRFNSAGSDEGRLNQALELINQSLALNPNNSSAELLKDQIETKIGGTAAVVLSSEDQLLLTRARNQLQQGNVDEANALMIQLLQKPQNIRVKSISDLKKRIDARL